MSERENATKNSLKRILRPLFEDQIKKGNISENVVNKIATLKEKSLRSQISLRTPEKPLDILRKLYCSINLYHDNYKGKVIKMFMYMSLLTAHRIGELCKTKRKHVDLDLMRVIAPSTITKTKVDYHYPLPIELKEYVSSLNPEDDLFPISKGSAQHIFPTWIKNADVKVFKDKKLNFHDFRRWMISVMIMDCKIDSALADACLEHSPEGVKKHYFHFTYEDKCQAFQKYWDKIKEDIDEDEKK